MKKSFVILIVLFLCCVCFVGCDFSPFRQVKTSAKSTKFFRVYVSGAVRNEGYIEVEEGADIALLVEKAGILPQTCFPSHSDLLVTENLTCQSFQWMLGNKVMSCINVNGSYVTSRRQVEGVDPPVINRIADYLEQHGKITDKTLLKEILGDDYEDNFYKFFVSMEDYEKIG